MSRSLESRFRTGLFNRVLPVTAVVLAAAMVPVAHPALAQDAVQPLERRGPLGTQQVDSPPDPVVQRTNQPGNDIQLTASAELKGRDGQSLGHVAFAEMPHGLLIQARLENVPPGGHGFHIHENGVCEPPDFKSAGGHLNPTGAEHGYLSPDGPHAGDLPNVYAGEDGVVRVDMFVPRLQIEPGSLSLLPSGSKAVVVHATVDDYATDPAGNAGDRIACGVIVSPVARAGTPAPESLPGSGNR